MQHFDTKMASENNNITPAQATSTSCSDNLGKMSQQSAQHQPKSAGSVPKRMVHCQTTTSASSPSLAGIRSGGASGTGTVSSTHSSPSASANRHNDPALYTALFKRKFVKVFTGWDLRERRWSRRGKGAKHPKAHRSKSGISHQASQSSLCGGSSQRASPCLQNCLECEASVGILKGLFSFLILWDVKFLFS